MYYSRKLEKEMGKDKDKNKAAKKQKHKSTIEEFIIAGDWVYTPPGKDFFDKEYIEIVEFFCFHSPCKKGSYSPRSLESLGWNNPWNYQKFKDKIKEIAGFDDKNFIMSETQYNFKALWESTGYINDFTKIRKPFAFFAYAGETNQYLDLLHRIRNSFAHGRYTIVRENREYYIYFEDVKDTNGNTCVMARICLTKRILYNLLMFFSMKNGMEIGFEDLIREKHSMKEIE